MQAARSRQWSFAASRIWPKAASDAAGWQPQAAARAAALAIQLLVTVDPKVFSRAPREGKELPHSVMHPRPLSEESLSTRPFWDPSTGRCRGIEGSPAIPGQWQVSAPRDIEAGRGVRPGQVVTLGLRKKLGQQNEMYWVGATAFAPDGTSTQTEQVLQGSEWLEVNYPTDFAGAPLLCPPGPYTVLSEVAEVSWPATASWSRIARPLALPLYKPTQN
jgi:hypothetical protein